MSRLIVKNLPDGVTEEQLRNLFSEKGHVTDIQLKYTRDRCFRKFAFIGYKSKEEAQLAIQSFNDSFISSTKIKVEICKSLGDPNKPRAWSKYAEGSSEYRKINDVNQEKPEKKKKKKKDKDVSFLKGVPGVKEEDAKLLRELENDAGFQEFLETYNSHSNKMKWHDDIKFLVQQYNEKKKDNETTKDESNLGSTTYQKLSDLEYLKSKIVKKKDTAEEFDEETRNNEKVTESKTNSSKNKNSNAVVMSGLRPHTNKKDILQFLAPFKPVRLFSPDDIPDSVVAQFASHKHVDKVLLKNQQYLGGNRITVSKWNKNASDMNKQNIKSYNIINPALVPGEEEPIADSGRLFIRNLSYFCTEEDLETLFKKYGLLTETYLPLDFFTKKIKGFGYVTFAIPENAVKAYSELDGTIFQGRMLHIIPAKNKPEEKEVIDEGSSYKKNKLAKLKEQSGSSHNWNTLFLGSNAVVNLMAEKNQISKSDILTANSKESVAVRVALGETQLVIETRDFLTTNGVCLDAFGQATTERSKTLILVKNLSAGTTDQELKDLFSEFGSVGRVLLPPNGITAIVEFFESLEARKAFKSLAYRKFKHLPLYLEWAPSEALLPQDKIPEKIKKEPQPEKIMVAEQSQWTDDSEESEDEDPSQPGRTIFVKNINFKTTEKTIREVFEKCGSISSVSIACKRDLSKQGMMVSLGYGFVEYKHKGAAQNALKQLQHCNIDEHQVELKLSHRTTTKTVVSARKKMQNKKQTSSKILVRNIPFEAKKHEVEKLFSVFGEIKSIRLPLKRFANTGSHRGFGFVDFINKKHAKRAFDALATSTHLYGRRLVLEWAETDDSLNTLRRKTADHYHQQGGPSKKRKKVVLQSLLADEENEEDMSFN